MDMSCDIMCGHDTMAGALPLKIGSHSIKKIARLCRNVLLMVSKVAWRQLTGNMWFQKSSAK